MSTDRRDPDSSPRKSDAYASSSSSSSVVRPVMSGSSLSMAASIAARFFSCSRRIFSSTVPRVISLKAGGVGLNLSAADTVIHFDPWWNPAVEAQATDRAHRIGQTRVVTAYKLITRDTVEDKILRLQEKKRAAIDAAIDSEEPLMTGLTTEELEELLA